MQIFQSLLLLAGDVMQILNLFEEEIMNKKNAVIWDVTSRGSS
jgi:hypothetical protein